MRPVVIVLCEAPADVGLTGVEPVAQCLDGVNKLSGHCEARIEQGVLGSLDPAENREIVQTVPIRLMQTHTIFRML